MKTDQLPTLAELTNEQRRILCAEALGIRGIWSYALPQKRIRCDVPDPDIEPADALALVEKLRGEGWSSTVMQLSWRDDWEVTVWHDRPAAHGPSHRDRHCATEPTFCRAVVSSFLKAKGVAR